jgi:hypothetical protein
MSFQVEVFLGGGRCEPGGLNKGHFDNRLSTNSFSGSYLAGTYLTAIVRTTQVYPDDPVFSAHYHMRDLQGRPQVDQVGLEVVLTITYGGTTVTGQCGLPDTLSGVGECLYDAEGIRQLAGNNDVSATARIAAQYYGVTAGSYVRTITLRGSRAFSNPGVGGAVARLPLVPKHAGETVTIDTFANTASKPLVSWYVGYQFNTQVLASPEFLGDPKYTQASALRSNQYSARALDVLYKVSTSGVLPGTTLAEVTGTRVLFNTIRFTIPTAATAATYEALTLTVYNFVDNNGAYIVESTRAGFIEQPLDSSALRATGQVRVYAPQVLGLYAYLEQAELFNMAYLTGVSVSSTATAVLVMSHPRGSGAGDLALPGNPTCTSGNTLAFGFARDGARCVLTLTSTHTRGTSASTATVSYGGFSEALPVRVWFPDQVDITVQDATLNAIQGAYQSTDCAALTPRYQRSKYWVGASFKAGTMGSMHLDVTCLVDVQLSGGAAVSSPARGELEGLAVGSATLTLANSRSTASAAVSTVAEEVSVRSMGGVLSTGASWAGVPDEEDASSACGTFTAVASLEQQLDHPGAKGPIFFLANFSDGHYEFLDPADGLTVNVNDGYDSSLIVTLENEQYYGEVPPVTDMPQGNVGHMLTGTWTDACSGATVAEGIAPVMVDVEMTALSIRTSERVITFNGDVSQCTLGLPVYAMLGVTATYGSDPGEEVDVTTSLGGLALLDYSVAPSDLVYIDPATGVATPIPGRTDTSPRWCCCCCVCVCLSLILDVCVCVCVCVCVALGWAVCVHWFDMNSGEHRLTPASRLSLSPV